MFPGREFKEVGSRCQLPRSQIVWEGIPTIIGTVISQLTMAGFQDRIPRIGVGESYLSLNVSTDPVYSEEGFSARRAEPKEKD